MIRLGRLCRFGNQGGTDSADSAWPLLAGSLVVGASLGFGYYLGKKAEQKAQRRTKEGGQRLKGEEEQTPQRRIIPGGFECLNEAIVRLIRGEVCSLTEELSEALRKREGLLKGGSCGVCLGRDEATPPHTEREMWLQPRGMQSSACKQVPQVDQIIHRVEMEVCTGRIRELTRKKSELQSYLDRGAPIVQLSDDPENPPEIFTCPISFEIMTNPVVAADGYTYEDDNIRKWLRTSRVSPKTNADMHSTLLQPNNSLRLAINSWRDEALAERGKTSKELVTISGKHTC